MGGGKSHDRTRWISARPTSLLSVCVLGALFRSLAGKRIASDS
jgi:hypothetical protein